MSIWMELMCDVRKEGQDPKDILRSRCHTNSGDHHSGHAVNTKVSVEAHRRLMEANAATHGWVKTKGQWACPGCKD